MPLTIHYIRDDVEVYTACGYVNWRSSWVPCEHLLELGPQLTDKERGMSLEVWGSDLSETHTYTRVWCRRCAQHRGYTW